MDNDVTIDRVDGNTLRPKRDNKSLPIGFYIGADGFIYRGQETVLDVDREYYIERRAALSK